MKQLIGLLVVLCSCLTAAAQTEKQIPDTMTIKRFTQLDSGTYFFIYSEFPKDSLHLGLDKPLKCPICPICPPYSPVTGFTITKDGQVIVAHKDGSTEQFALKNTIIIQ